MLVSPIINALAGPAWAKRPSILPLRWFVILGVTIALLAGMAFLVVAETFIPSGSMPGPLYLAGGVRNGLGRTEAEFSCVAAFSPTCGADAGPSSAPRMVASAWPTPYGWRSKKAAPDGSKHSPRPSTATFGSAAPL